MNAKCANGSRYFCCAPQARWAPRWTAAPATRRARGDGGRDCSLCREAEKQPAGVPFFFLKDNSPLKPNQWLILPRTHASDGRLPLSKLSAAERTAFWTAAIARARALFGDGWGLALNGDEVRSQCHMHVHIGPPLRGRRARPAAGGGWAGGDPRAEGRWWHVDPSGGEQAARPPRRSEDGVRTGPMNLVDIAPAASAENAAILLHASDNVAIARVPLSPGRRLEIAGRSVTVAEPIPPGHKVALAAIARGENVLRYGQRIGRASQPIEAGRHVHTHNLAFEELAFDYEFPTGEIDSSPRPPSFPAFLGYARDGTGAPGRATTSRWWRPATARPTRPS
jgi:diadenosine tetraphosphate (Ap4A) HIT family hydrolase